MLTLDVGSMTEEVSVTSRVTELQSTSGERSFTLESEALKNIANNGAQLFNFATLVPGALSQNTGGSEIGAGERLHGQRPAAELQQRHDRRRRQHRHRQQRRQHGDDQHRRRRRVQGPHQLLSGRVRPRRRRPGAGRHQERHAAVPRLGLLVRPAVRLERQHVDEQAGHAGDRPRPRRHATTPATPSAGRSSSPASTRTRRGCSSSGARSGSGAPIRQASIAGARAHRPRAERRLLTERRQQRQSVPLHSRLHHRAAVQRRRHARLLRRTAACSAGSRRAASTRPASPR